MSDKKNSSINNNDEQPLARPGMLKQFQSFMSMDSAPDVSISDLVGEFPRRIVRTGSVILAETGERTRTVNIYNHFDENQENEDLERQPLIERASREPWWKFHVFDTIRRIDKKYLFVLKCSLAYLLASLAVYNGKIAGLLGKSDNKHVVATVAVYFHPSRTFGSMHQSIIFVVISLIYSFSVSLFTTGLSSLFYRSGHEHLSTLTNLLFLSIAQGFVSYMKQKMNHPTFNTACSLASISLISAIVKEGAVNSGVIPIARLVALFKIVCLGSLIAILVCYTIIPTSATKNLIKHLNESCSLMSRYLSKVERSFLHGSYINSMDSLSALSSTLKKNSSSLDSALNEAKFELYLVGHEQEYSTLRKLVRSTQLLESQLRGLKNSADMQWYCLHENNDDDSTVSFKLSTPSIRTLNSQDFEPAGNNLEFCQSTESLEERVAVNSSQLFDLFIYYLGPSLESFSYTIRGVLDGMPLKSSDNYPTKETSHYKMSLKLARDLFTKKHEKAITKLYEQSFFQNLTSMETKIDEEEVAASCGNFASILIQFSKELDNFIDLLNEYSMGSESTVYSWNWLKFWKSHDKDIHPSKVLDFNLADFNGLNFEQQQRNKNLPVNGVKKFKYKFWRFLSFFRKIEVQFGIRVGLGVFALASLAFLSSTKQTFMEWRGEWALVTFCIIMNKSLGGTTMTVNWRFLGTFLGAFMAYVIWSLSDGNGIVLCVSGWLISCYCFYIVLYWPSNNAFGRFILLTYNITALYSYNITRSEDLEEGDDTDPIIGDIAIHRFLGIMAGVLWALIMTITFLPTTARRRLKKGLSMLWLKLGIIWKRDALSVTEDGYLSGLSDQRFINKLMRELELLLKQAPKELRLKGAFPSDAYKKLMKSSEKIIDSFQNLNTMISVEPKMSLNESLVLQYTEQERDELENRVFLIFYMIASSITLGYPIPNKPASTEHSKDRLMVKLGEIRRQELLSNEDFVLLYSYILVSNMITRELNKIIKLLGELFGHVDEEIFEM